MTDQQEMVLQLHPSVLIKIWCEYDINGDFGGNNNEDVCRVTFPADMSEDEYASHISKVVEEHVTKQTDLDADELDGLYDWSHISPVEL